jgi:hypothetical protein
MNTIDRKRRKDLERKFGINEPPQANNAVVAAITRADQICGRLFTRDSSELFDPTRSPQMYDVAQRALRDLHAAMGEPVDSIAPDDEGRLVAGEAPPTVSRVTFDNHDGPGDDFAALDPDDPALYVHLVGDNSVVVVRGPKPVGAFDLATRGPGRPRRGADYFVGLYQFMFDSHDEFWDRPCNVNVSRSCGGRPTQLVPYRAGAFLLLFEVCEACVTYAEAAANIGHDMSLIEAHARQGLPSP